MIGIDKLFPVSDVKQDPLRPGPLLTEDIPGNGAIETDIILGPSTLFIRPVTVPHSRPGDHQGSGPDVVTARFIFIDTLAMCDIVDLEFVQDPSLFPCEVVFCRMITTGVDGLSRWYLGFAGVI